MCLSLYVDSPMLAHCFYIRQNSQDLEFLIIQSIIKLDGNLTIKVLSVANLSLQYLFKKIKGYNLCIFEYIKYFFLLLKKAEILYFSLEFISWKSVNFYNKYIKQPTRVCHQRLTYLCRTKKNGVVASKRMIKTVDGVFHSREIIQFLTIKLLK